MRISILGVLFGAAAMLASCANTPEPRESSFPILATARSEDTALSCPQIVDQVQIAAALHREIGWEEARLVSDDVVWGGLGILADPVTGLVGAALSGANADVRGKRYEEARTAAQRRIVALLGLARAANCSDPPTDSLAKLDSIAAMPQVHRRDLRAKRTALLAFFDGFAVNPPAAMTQQR